MLLYSFWASLYISLSPSTSLSVSLPLYHFTSLSLSLPLPVPFSSFLVVKPSVFNRIGDHRCNIIWYGSSSKISSTLLKLNQLLSSKYNIDEQPPENEVWNCPLNNLNNTSFLYVQVGWVSTHAFTLLPQVPLLRNSNCPITGRRWYSYCTVTPFGPILSHIISYYLIYTLPPSLQIN